MNDGRKYLLRQSKIYYHLFINFNSVEEIDIDMVGLLPEEAVLRILEDWDNYRFMKFYRWHEL